MAYYIVNRETEEKVGAFIHVPRTGGTFIRQAIDAAGFGTVMIGRAHQPVSVVEPELFTFTFIRHPETWYPSLFHYERENGWPGSTDFPWLGEFGANNVGEFVQHVERFYPMGYVRQVMDRAIHYDGRRADFVGKYSYLYRDLARVFRVMGMAFTQEQIEAMPPANASRWKEHGMSEYTRQAICRLEADFIREWYE